MASANPLRQAAIRRKWLYFGLIVALFTISIFWRGKLTVPFSGQLRPSAWLTERSVLAQAQRLDLRELDQGDPEIATSSLRVSLVGARGVALTVVWRGAIEKQKRNEFHEFEMLARLATRLQPHFITPWVFQSWNIAYNVSVENDKLGDMYFYIARGIELLAEGDRLNTKTYVDSQGQAHRIGSPDIRYQIGFYYQNKFSVSDKVNTLRCLMQLSCIRPSDRQPAALQPEGGTVDPAAFREFCLKNPQLVRRLRTKLNCARPEDVVQFLRDNERVPSLYANPEDPADLANFPVLPPQFPEGPDEYYPGKGVDDTFDAFHASRAWFAYSLTVVPPPKTDESGEPLPWRSPQPGEYNPFLYRMPRAPTLIIFRQQAPRSQTYLAERLQKEGWFDATTRWDPDERASAGNAWFARTGAGDRQVLLATPVNSQAEYARAWQMWDYHGQKNALILPPGRRAQLEEIAGVRGTPSYLPPDMTKEEMEARGLDPKKVEAIKALVYYEQNRSITNFAYFLESTRAEKDPLTVEARKLLWEADQARQNAENLRATQLYVEALAKWREVLREFPQFHRSERSDHTEEETYEYEINLIDLLKEDGRVRARAERITQTAAALHPVLGTAEVTGADYLQAAAEEEAVARITAESVARIYPRLKNPSDAEREVVKRVGIVTETTPALGGILAGAIQPVIVRGVIDSEFAWMKEFKEPPQVRDPVTGYYERSAYWVSPFARETIKLRLNRIRRVAGPPEPMTAREPPPASAVGGP